MQTPYDKYKKLEVWKVLKRTIRGQVKNSDILLTTHEDYVIGFIIEKLDKKQLLKTKK
ncbi:MAG: hypothetical protein KBF42_01975 [Chitinophagales bacterium]|jgi:hypothetical protein|nr:hypothetical protein [Bacteroidota bacterium]MBK7568446.1 hypothetical protein [Bacteroidota bacterium]MBP8916152.1 hypothetical protein [Chitinophagales bacterium]MBP9220122.1 hypothetical protein [Chitinophagales bacterium]MBP9794972.1 hypothetical protein [Chitinophagales bacterium]